ncbi:molybdopterin converting factor subunit 1 [Microvirga sp. W0021]|uniref:Molybdopterin converting factor subunit 1 n=1 Tax=Hohaiivirga grylli TaxID=3133970 RepID=A0ABV0BKL7_9HYPH
MKLVYFAWVRERLGKPEEDICIPGEVKTVSQLLEWLKGQGEEYAYAFENIDVIEAAINQEHVTHDASLEDAHEIAFFPPMTGG